MASTPLILQGCWQTQPPVDPWTVVIEGALVVLATLLLFFVFLLATAPIYLGREGVWIGNQFKYLRPKLAFSASLGSMDNRKIFSFRFPDAPPFAWLEYEIEFDRAEAFDLTPVAVSWSAAGVDTLNALAFMPHRPKFGGVMLNGRRELYVAALTQPNKGPYTVSIFVKSWTHH